VHIFSRGWSMNKRNTTTDASAFASVARRPRREAFLVGTAFPGVTSALKRRRTPGYSPTTPAGWYSQSPRVYASLPKTGSMCTNFKNRVRFASRAARLTCTKNLAHATFVLEKWCITTYTDVCTVAFIPISTRSASSAVDLPGDVHPTCRLFKNFVGHACGRGNRMSFRRPALPWNNAPGATNRGRCAPSCTFFRRIFWR